MNQRPFQQYQAEFNAYLRNPAQQLKPHGINAKRLTIYREIVFNNFLSSISACFPVLLSLIGKRRFKRLVRHCFASHHFNSPLFADIPKTFVDFLQNLNLTQQELPPYTDQLAHYEWIELQLAKLPDNAGETFQVTVIQQTSDLADLIPQLPDAHQLLHYDYPVHQLSKRHAQLPASPTYLLVFRKADFKIAFIQLNAMTFYLLQCVQLKKVTATDHFRQLGQIMLPHLPLPTVLEFGLNTLKTLHMQQAMIFYQK